MTVVLVLAAWFGLGCLTWALFVALFRRERDVDAEVDAPSPREDVDLPGPRGGSDRVVRPTTRAE